MDWETLKSLACRLLVEHPVLEHSYPVSEQGPLSSSPLPVVQLQNLLNREVNGLMLEDD